MGLGKDKTKTARYWRPSRLLVGELNYIIRSFHLRCKLPHEMARFDRYTIDFPIGKFVRGAFFHGKCSVFRGLAYLLDEDQLIFTELDAIHRKY